MSIRKAPSGTIGYDADLIDEQNMVSQQASKMHMDSWRISAE